VSRRLPSIDSQIDGALKVIDLTPCNGCDACGLRCAAGVQMSRAEFEQVNDYTEQMRPAELDRVMRQDKRVDLGDDVIVQMCRYRDMERNCCAVYPARPLTCRLIGHVEWLPCPIEKITHTLPTRRALDLMESYSRIERHTFEEWDSLTGKKP